MTLVAPAAEPNLGLLAKRLEVGHDRAFSKALLDAAEAACTASGPWMRAASATDGAVEGQGLDRCHRSGRLLSPL